MRSEPTVSRLSAALANDLPVDWEFELAQAPDEHLRAQILQMQVLGSIAAAHRQAALCETSAGESVGTSAPAASLPSLGRWGHLELIEELGTGTFGTVYRAWDRRLARHVALKMFPASDSYSKELIEARLLARLRHRSVVTVFGADRIEERVGLWMELIEGRTLENALRMDGPYSAREALAIVQEVCGALAAVHQAGLLHRDVKAQNIMRERGGRIVLMDFGAGQIDAVLTDTPLIDLAGTPLYMAPERLAGEPASVQSDLYSAGVLLFRLVSGAFPVVGETLAEVRRAHQRGDRRHLRDYRPELPSSLDDLIDRALAPTPADRFRSAGEMSRALAAVSASLADSDHAATSRSSRRALPGSARTSHRTAITVLSTIAATAAAVLLLEHGPRGLWPRGRQPPATPVAPGLAETSSEPRDAPAVGMSQEQRDLIWGFEELAGSLGAKGEWGRVSEIYEQIRTLHRDTIGEFAPVSGLNIARTAWAHHRAGNLEGARYLYEEALVKQETTLGKLHPYTATTMGALAMLHFQAGRRADATAWLGRALQSRRQLLGVVSQDDIRRGLPDLAAVEASKLPLESLLSDTDGDGLLPVIEAVLGLDSSRTDSDGDGTSDGDEISPGSPHSLCVWYCLAIDPTKVLAHFGSTNPRREGFFRHYPFDGAGTESDATAWRMQTGPLGYYFQRLTSGQKAAAVKSGWRLMFRGRVRLGVAYAMVDLTPLAQRWDINLSLTPAGTMMAQLPTSVVPLEGAELPIESGETLPLLELVSSPPARQVWYYSSGVLRAVEHRGTTQFQDDRGLIFGSGNREQTGRGSAEFALVWLEIR